MVVEIAMSQIGRLISVEIFQFLKNTTFTFRMDLLLDDLVHPPDSTICNVSSSISVDLIGRFVCHYVYRFLHGQAR